MLIATLVVAIVALAVALSTLVAPLRPRRSSMKPTAPRVPAPPSRRPMVVLQSASDTGVDTIRAYADEHPEQTAALIRAALQMPKPPLPPAS